MPNRVQWNPRYSVGNETLDDQHRMVLEQCNALADHVVETSPESDLRFHTIFNELTAGAREHFSKEEELLIQCACPTLEEHKNECNEFEYLSAEIITTENFDKLELQRFLIFWWVGHILDSGERYRASIAGSPAD
ncbi:hemerythrin family protein [Propionivibrio sp.]|uniref:bacteriohemerythrin n=1 Tax=Propionivibrio sp. TaxID=2212460 RepID=UPI0025ECCDE5|nr:hemerythrin family protein [Propionivibrio sp.]MBK7355601.1 hemerythrin family protein [Propionivibrio sp.]MBK8400729.1 hemerythrin family protein [Propionivibrio sp.]MBK8744760.1 hemerythrin family protein [Propionivibrio sp.]MBK8893266.1 hemerythrin family protein [Propionivibrio sp.]